MTETEVQQMIEETRDFQTLPKAASEIVRLTLELSAPVREIAQLLQREKPLLKKMLAVINSPFYQFDSKVSKIDQALSVLGYRKIGSLAVGLSLLDRFPPEQAGEIDYRKFWERTLCNAVAAGEITACLRGDLSEEAFTIGLLQDVGNLLLMRCRPFGYGQAVGLAKGMDIHIVRAEREILGIDHTAVSALLCQNWKLPSSLVDIVQNHHFSEFTAEIPLALKTTIQVANLANLLADVFYEADPEERRKVLYTRADGFFHFNSGLVDKLLEKIPVQLRSIGQALSIPVSREIDAEKQESEEQYAEACPKCGAPGSGKFCADCGASLLIVSERLPLSDTKVLIADDNAATRLALRILTQRLGYQPIEASNGPEALRLARRERPGVILMDITMPGMTGLQVLERIRQEKATEHIPVVMLTSITSSETVIESLQSGANDYVVKPFSAATIQNRIEKYMSS